MDRRGVSSTTAHSATSFTRKGEPAARPTFLPLPVDRPRPAVRYRGASETLLLPSDLVNAIGLTGIAGHEGPVPMVLAAFAVLLHRYCGEDDVLVGVPASAFGPEAVAGTARSLGEMLPMWIDLAGDPEFVTLVERVRKASRERGNGQQIADAAPAQSGAAAAKPNVSACFQIRFNFISASSVDGTSLDGSDRFTSQAPNSVDEELALRIAGHDGIFDSTFDYNAELFDAATMRRMLGHLQVLLRRIAENPRERISVLPMLTRSERRELLVDWNPPAAPAPASPRKWIHEAFEAQATRTPEAVAIVAGKEQLTYRELDAGSNRLANHLRKLGVGPNVPVGVSLERSPNLVIGILGILKAGGAYVPLEPSHPPAQLAALLKQTRPAILLTQQRFVTTFHSDRRLATLCLDTERQAIAAESSTSTGVHVTGQDMASVLFSSGSTGTPKAILRLHAAVGHDPRTQSSFQIDASDRHVLKSTLDSTLLGREIFWPLLTGGTMFIAAPGKSADVAPLLSLLRDDRITMMSLVPSLLRLLLEHEGLEACTSLRHVACFGEPLPADLETRFCQRLSADLWSYYGTTEAPSLTLRQCCRKGAGPLGNLGYPIRTKQVYVLDSRLQPVPIGVPGELYAGGPSLALGYPNQRETTDERFIANPFVEDSAARLYRTGDRARWRADGSLEFIGRRDDQVKIRGYRVEPAEVEAALLRHPDLRDVAVLARQSATGENELAAYFVAGHRALPISDLRAFVRQRLPEHMVPSIFVRLEAMPRRPNGKVDRNALPDPERGRLEAPQAFIAPRTPVEERLAAIWCDVLGLTRVGVRDDFFDLGGHSLLAARVIDGIERAFGRRIPLNALWYKGGTVANLAELLRADERSIAWRVMVPIKPQGRKPCLFVVHTIGGHLFHYDELARALDPEQPVIGLQARDAHGRDEPRRKIEDIAGDCIVAMRERQSSGPYSIAGYSSGGVVAFEIARQLSASGETVGLLALLDTRAPHARVRRTPLWVMLGRIRRPRPRLIQEKLYHVVLHHLGLGHWRRLRRIGEAQRWAHWSYAEAPYGGDALLLIASASSEITADDALGWERLINGGIRRHVFSATHGSLMQDPVVNDLATKLQSELDAVAHRHD